jgi:hypothetical protein
MVVGLGVIYVTVTFLACYAGSSEFAAAIPGRLLGTIVVTSLALTAYAAGFAWLSMVTRWAMILGIIYAVLIEFVLASLPFALRRLTVMFYFRALSLDWLDLGRERALDWRMENADDVPSSVVSVAVLLGVACVTTLLGMMQFSRREFHVKTPEGN